MMKRDHTMLVSVALLVVGAAIGWMIGGPVTRGEQGESLEQGADRVGIPQAGRWDMSHVPDGARRMADAMRRAPAGKEQMRAAIELANNVPVDEIEAWLDGHFADTTDGWVDWVCGGILTARFYEADPERCVARCFLRDPDRIEELMNRWTREDPDAAEGFVLALENPGWRVRAADLLMAEMARNAPQRALELIARLGAEDFEAHRYSNAFQVLAETHREALLSAAEAWRPDLRKLALHGVANEWLKEDFRGALEWLEKDPSGRKLFVEACNREQSLGPMILETTADLPAGWMAAVAERSSFAIMRENPVAWLRADAASLGISDQALERVHRYAAGWLGNLTGSHEEARALLAERPDLPRSIRTALVGSIVTGWARDDRAAAEAWLAGLAEEELRSAGMQRLPDGEPRNDYAPVTPNDWLENLLTTESAADYTMLRRTEYWTAEEVAGAQAAFRALPAAQREQAAQVMLERANHHLGPPLMAEAVNEVLTADDPNERDVKAACDVAAHWGRLDPPGAAAWVESLPPGQAREWAARNLVMVWARQSEAETQEWIGRLESAEERGMLEEHLKQ